MLSRACSEWLSDCVDHPLKARMSFPPALRNPSKLNSAKRLDIDLIVSVL